MKKISLVSAALVVLAMTTSATAYEVTVRASTNAKTDETDNDAESVNIFNQPGPYSQLLVSSAMDGDTEALARASVAVNGGSIAVGAYTSLSGEVDTRGGTVLDRPSVGADTIVTLIIDDIIFTGPGSSTTTTLNLAASGFFNANAFASPGVIAFSSARVDMSVQFDMGIGSLDFVGFQSKAVNHNTIANPGLPPAVSEIENGDLTGVSFPDTLNIGSFNVSLNNPYTLKITLGADSSGRIDGFGSAVSTGIADFGHTVSFPTAGAVFELAPGYSVNSVSADIVNNEWLGEPVSTTVVPLPGALWMLLPALGWLVRKRPAR